MLTNLGGLFAASESSRVNVTEPAVSSVGVLRDEDPACRRCRPQGRRIRSAARDRRYISTGKGRSTVVCRGYGQSRRASRTNGHEVTASRIRPRGCKLRAIGFKECLVASPILGPPDTQRSLEYRSCADRIRNDGSVKLRTLATGHDRTTRDDPLHWIAIPEVHIVEVRSERVKPKRGVAHVEARLTTVAVDYLRPVSRRIARFFKCTVILRATHQVVCV